MFISQYSGILLGDNFRVAFITMLVIVLALGFLGAPFIVWTIVVGALLIGFNAPVWVLAVFAVIAVVFNIKPIRQMLVSSVIMKVMKIMEFIPRISETERTALEAGVVWVEGDLFSGKPDFKKLMNEPYPRLTSEEQAFIDGPVERLCTLVDDWSVWKTREIPPEAWAIIKKEKFLGMIIPKEYGGLGFSAMAHSEVIHKLATRCIPLSITVMVPNSLGPAELLIHYGTDAQKKHLLPKLASGEELPCFALTEPNAGSDAGSIVSEGTLFKGTNGKLQIKLNWNKRWITLAAISTTLGLAFRLRDPENLLGKGTDIGITCALIPSHTPGVVLGRRHDPLTVPFYNCPTQGKDVIVNAEDVIVGGLEGAGKGWKMLMECLSAGRGISLPAQNSGGTKMSLRVVSAHATIRKQFGIPIGKFEGIEEPLSRIAGFSYICEALRRFTLGALDKGIKPPVVTAIAKYHSTELSRKAINDAMDVMGGAGISLGPKNLLAHGYLTMPIGITVEGANILTRTLIIFGQGAMRAHPFAFKEVNAMEKGDTKAFDRAFWGHIGHVVRNLFRSVLLSITRGYLVANPVGGSLARYYRKLSWVSASFAIMADIAMASLGGTLKQKEKITGRFADILSWMYIGTAILRRYQADGSRKEDLPFVHFTMNYAFYEMQQAFDGIFSNLSVPGLSWFFKGPIRWWSGLNTLGNRDTDDHSHKIATLVMTDSAQRDRMAEGIFIPTNPSEHFAQLEEAFKVCKKAEEIERKIRKAVHTKLIPKVKGAQLLTVALEKGIITKDEHTDLVRSEKLRWEAIQVDDFSQEEFLGHKKPEDKPAFEPRIKRMEA
ncbi:MAG: acyl-CoA dehydrogenase [Oligoflexia bacterium]|nr:acyl-CoA dehydrogenase [Oligoflexia bacterium]